MAGKFTEQQLINMGLVPAKDVKVTRYKRVVREKVKIVNGIRERRQS